MDRCAQCGFVYQAVPVTDVAGRVRSLPASYAEALSETCPVFAPMRRDERAVEERYDEQDVAVVLDELATAAGAFATALDGLEAAVRDSRVYHLLVRVPGAAR